MYGYHWEKIDVGHYWDLNDLIIVQFIFYKNLPECNFFCVLIIFKQNNAIKVVFASHAPLNIAPGC